MKRAFLLHQLHVRLLTVRRQKRFYRTKKRSRGMKRTRAPHREEFYYRISKRFTNTSAEQHHGYTPARTHWRAKGRGWPQQARCWGRDTAAGTRTSRSPAVATRPLVPRRGKPKREKELQRCSIPVRFPSETKTQRFHSTGRISSLLAEVRCALAL